MMREAVDRPVRGAASGGGALIGYWLIGSVDWLLLSSLLIGSLPGIYAGSHFTALVADKIHRRC
jgi:uncharacterized membrane protein YfcA